jgi:tryptophan synthase alpha chain
MDLSAGSRPAARLDKSFARLRARGETGLIIYITAGDPDLETTEALVLALEAAGADAIELGVPFTDPLADGPSVQAATERALRSGTTLPQVLELVARLRKRTEIPVVLMTYFNPAFRYGLERLAGEAQAAGIDGFIMTDLPPEEAGDWKAVADAHALATVFLLAPTSTPERIRLGARLSTGFVYCVSRTGVTGARRNLPEDLQALLERIRAETDQPIAVGFGISTPEHVRQVGQWADAAVVGSAVVDRVGQWGREAAGPVGEFVRQLKFPAQPAD